MGSVNTLEVGAQDIERQLRRLNDDYARVLDDDQLEEWPSFFVEDGLYAIHPRENYRLGLDGYLLYLDNRAMLRDRVTSLREANLYSIHQGRHFTSGVIVDRYEDGLYFARSSYLIIQTDVSGHARVFSVGEYHDKLVLTEDGLKLKERRVVVDNFNIEGMIAVPL